MNKYRFHVVSLPHTQSLKEWSPCAYTQKVVKFCEMMKSLGHEVILYASEENDAPCDELVTCITKKEQMEFFGGTDWRKDFFPIEWDNNLPYWRAMNNRAIAEIEKRKKPKDFVCLIGGWCQKPIADALPDMMSVEFGIGYRGIFSPYKVFESYAWMHYNYGLQNFQNGQNYDCVIPNYWDPKDFPFSAEKDDYFLYIGRMISRKGPHIAAEACGIKGEKLVLAGQGFTEITDTPNGKKYKSREFELEGKHFDYKGVVGPEERGKLMSRAKAVFVQTQYIGPFEGVAVEAMMCGTPIITTDWGCFTEYNHDGITGFRTRTMGEILHAMDNVGKLDYAQIRKYAIDNFSLDRVRMQYQAYFDQLHQLWEKGWYSHEYNPSNKRYEHFI